MRYGAAAASDVGSRRRCRKCALVLPPRRSYSRLAPLGMCGRLPWVTVLSAVSSAVTSAMAPGLTVNRRRPGRRQPAHRRAVPVDARTWGRRPTRAACARCGTPPDPPGSADRAYGTCGTHRCSQRPRLLSLREAPAGGGSKRRQSSPSGSLPPAPRPLNDHWRKILHFSERSLKRCKRNNFFSRKL